MIRLGVCLGVGLLALISWLVLAPSEASPASLIQGVWRSEDGDSELSFQPGSVHPHNGEALLRWRMTPAWAARLPKGFVDAHRSQVGAWVRCSLSYTSTAPFRFVSFGGWAGDGILLPLAPPGVHGFRVRLVDERTIDVHYPPLPEAIRYVRAAP